MAVGQALADELYWKNMIRLHGRDAVFQQYMTLRMGTTVKTLRNGDVTTEFDPQQRDVILSSMAAALGFPTLNPISSIR